MKLGSLWWALGIYVVDVSVDTNPIWGLYGSWAPSDSRGALRRQAAYADLHEMAAGGQKGVAVQPGQREASKVPLLFA